MIKVLYVSYGEPTPSGATTIMHHILKDGPKFGLKFSLVEILRRGERELVEIFPDIEKSLLTHLVFRVGGKDFFGKVSFFLFREFLLKKEIRDLEEDHDIVIGFPSSKSANFFTLEPFVKPPYYRVYYKLLRMTNPIEATVWFIRSAMNTTKSMKSLRNICLGEMLRLELKEIGINCVPLEPPGAVEWDAVKTANTIDDIDIFHASRLGPMKGTPEAVEVMKQLSTKGYKVAIAGPLDNGFSLKEIKGLRYLGNITDKSLLYSYMKSSKIFLYPSHKDSFGIVVAE
ncbi:glycosyltransferase, partial [Acidianus sp. RZ1]|uniref:glycosyltransferase n=1 Tax=Acidianus sp. RZ1 TaxID=1540082 RepID=UPI0014914A99